MGIKALIAEVQPPARAVIWDTVGQDALDIASINALKGLVIELKAKWIEIYVAEAHAPMRDFSRRTGLVEMIGKDHKSQPLTTR